jgi:hypothetical protein
MGATGECLVAATVCCAAAGRDKEDQPLPSEIKDATDAGATKRKVGREQFVFGRKRERNSDWKGTVSFRK